MTAAATRCAQQACTLSLWLFVQKPAAEATQHTSTSSSIWFCHAMANCSAVCLLSAGGYNTLSAAAVLFFSTAELYTVHLLVDLDTLHNSCCCWLTSYLCSPLLQAFDSPGYPHLATLGVGVDWNDKYLLRTEGNYRPRWVKRSTRYLLIRVRAWGGTQNDAASTSKIVNSYTAGALCGSPCSKALHLVASGTSTTMSIAVMVLVLLGSLLTLVVLCCSCRFKLEPLVIRIPIVPGSDPRICYG